MASFHYKAKTLNGEIVTGKFDAQDRNMVISLLRSKGYFPLLIKEAERVEREIKLLPQKKVSIKDLAIFCKQFYTMINAGVTVIGCLDLLRRQTENKRLVKVIGNVYDDLQKGMALSETIRMHPDVFPPIMINMIEVGEVSGTLDLVLKRLTTHFEKDNKIKQKIKTAMAYPAVIGCIALVMVVFMLTFIVPKFVGVFLQTGGELPLPTKILVTVSNTVKNIWFLLGAAVTIGILVHLLSRFKKSEIGRSIISNLIIRLPLIGSNVKKIIASRFTRSLSLLLMTGIPLVQALEVVDRVVNNPIVTKGLVKVEEEIKRGSSLAGPLEGMGIFPAMVTQMISVGEEAGSLDSIIETVADFYDEELDVSISRLISLLEPIMIFVLALIVGGIVISMMLPVFGMNKSLKG